MTTDRQQQDRQLAGFVRDYIRRACDTGWYQLLLGGQPQDIPKTDREAIHFARENGWLPWPKETTAAPAELFCRVRYPDQSRGLYCDSPAGHADKHHHTSYDSGLGFGLEGGETVHVWWRS